MTDLLLGIDTGGTYTDGVLLDEGSRQVIATTKTLTTRHDLTECILTALDNLIPDDPNQINLVAISTTLATNAIAAPTEIFLPRVAEILDTELIIPPHYQVANAVAALSGSVIGAQEARVYPKSRGMHV